MRHPVRNAVLFGLIGMAGVVLVVLGAVQLRATGRTGSPLLVLGLFPALLCPLFFIHYLGTIRVFRGLRSGRSALARWTLPADQFQRFLDNEQRIPAGSILANFYQPPRVAPAAGLEVIFACDGVLIGDGYFPLSATDRRRLQSVRYIASDPPSIQFGTVIHTLVRTSSATTATSRTAETLRVPVAADAVQRAADVVRRYQAVLDRAASHGR